MNELLNACKQAIKNSYAPYSGFRVAAAVKTEDGKVYTGVNIENASYGLTVCAERVAVFKAVSSGSRKIIEVMVYVEDDPPAPPCGACLQVIAEFSENPRIYMVSKTGRVITSTLDELLPLRFSGDKLRGK